MAGLFDKIRQKLFGNNESKQPDDTHIRTPIPIGIDGNTGRQDQKPAVAGNADSPTSRDCKPEEKADSVRNPYFIQLGLDFGTAFCKCICRDMYLDKAWVYIPGGKNANQLPFLLTSVVMFENGTLRYSNDNKGVYREGGLHQLKMALEKVGLENWDAPILEPYKAAANSKNNIELAQFIEACGVFLLGGMIGNVRREISRRFPGRVDGDYLPVNMAVPVADADHSGVNACFYRILRLSWLLADELAGHPPIALEKLNLKIGNSMSMLDNKLTREACYIYPEVSANVQAFVRARASRAGFYLFSDTGAGTVDQSLFEIVPTSGGKYHLSYFYAQVLPVGSSQIEHRAAEWDGKTSIIDLDHLRAQKERGEKSQPLEHARNSIYSELLNGTNRAVSKAKKFLRVRRKINGLRVIFGGGGHCKNPYRKGVIKVFDGNLFVTDKIEKRKLKGDTFDVGMPMPPDLHLKKDQRHWLKRLTVAYGLSFEKNQLATSTLPGNLPDLEPDESSPESVYD